MTAYLEPRAEGEYTVCGDLNWQSVTELWHRSQTLFRNRPPGCIDFSGVTRSDSTGVALLIEWLQLARRHDTSLRFVNIPSQMQAIIEVTDLEELLVGH